MRSFDPTINSPGDNLRAIESINRWINPQELIGTQNGIENFLHTLENMSKYIEGNVNKIGSLRPDYIKAIQELRRNLRNIADHPDIAPMERNMLTHIEQRVFVKNIYSLNPQLGPTVE